MLTTIARGLLGLLGWTLSEPAGRPPRAVMIAYPHTSNWDGIYALLTKLALGLDVHWVAKASLFCWPAAWLLRRMGGIPVNRRSPQGLVGEMVEQFASHPEMLLVIAPEGTRGLTGGWKSGFYRIAMAAGVPVALGFVDYAKREAGILAYLSLTGDREADLAEIARHYQGRSGKYPELTSPIRWLE